MCGRKHTQTLNNEKLEIHTLTCNREVGNTHCNREVGNTHEKLKYTQSKQNGGWKYTQ